MSAQIETPAKTGPSEDEVLRQIEQAVLDHRLPPGTKLKEVQLATLFGVKRGLIRKVLTRLAHSRLVDQTPNRGATVAKPSVKEGQDLFATRRVIESAILETLITRVDAKMINRLRKLLEREQEAYQRGDSETGAGAIGRFPSPAGGAGRQQRTRRVPERHHPPHAAGDPDPSR